MISIYEKGATKLGMLRRKLIYQGVACFGGWGVDAELTPYVHFEVKAHEADLRDRRYELVLSREQAEHVIAEMRRLLTAIENRKP